MTESIPIRALHVEDSAVQQRLIAHYLKSVPEFAFQVATATSEEEALDVFGAGGIGLVLLDYHLREGNGLSCLRRIRELDSMVPIIAVSATADQEIAAQLVSHGADDFLDKGELNPKTLASSVRTALQRVTRLRPRLEVRVPGTLFEDVVETAESCLQSLPKGFGESLRRLEGTCRSEALDEPGLQGLFRRAAERLGGRDGETELVLRPMFLELRERLFTVEPIRVSAQE